MSFSLSCILALEMNGAQIRRGKEESGAGIFAGQLTEIDALHRHRTFVSKHSGLFFVLIAESWSILLVICLLSAASLLQHRAPFSLRAIESRPTIPQRSQHLQRRRIRGLCQTTAHTGPDTPPGVFSPQGQASAGFQRLLDGSGASASVPQAASGGGSSSSYTGKSWTRGGVMPHNTSTHGAEFVNARDRMGRTTLHLACNSVENIEYVRALLKHPQIDINLPDTESHWTPLHRALYAANLPVALLLLQRADIDVSLKDWEGYTAFDLYNSTLNGTKPNAEDGQTELLTWGANRNAALGVSDADDRTYPDRVNIASKEDPFIWSKMDLVARLSPISVQQIQMSKLHTVVVTNERESNIRLCGFGSGGRLGQAQHTQYSLKPFPTLQQKIVRVAVGQDHTLALTKNGEIYSWGLNRFSQLGYVVDPNPNVPAIGKNEESIQSVPKRVVGLLRREFVRGVAASKNASACWTKESVFTWGTNTGHLGYDKSAQPVQVSPRPVTKFSNEVVDIAMSETVIAALLVTHQVECLYNDRHYRVTFPLHAFPSGIEPYRPPQSIKDSLISKVTCCDETFAALSLNGEVFTFAAPKAASEFANSGEGRSFAPQRVWALRKKFSAVKDVALGADGSIIICTESGHVFVRSRNPTKSSSGKAFKFERVPFLQRVTQVCANSTGAYGALRVDYKPRPIEIEGNNIAQDMKKVQPYMELYKEERIASLTNPSGETSFAGDYDSMVYEDEQEDTGIQTDIDSVRGLCQVLSVEHRMRKSQRGSVNFTGPGSTRMPYNSDTLLQLHSGETFPAHRVLLAARSSVLHTLFVDSQMSVNDPTTGISIRPLLSKPGPGRGVLKITRLAVTNCNPLALLILMHYIYSDELLAVWDRRVTTAVADELRRLGTTAVTVKRDVQALAKMLDLPVVLAAMETSVRREPTPTMAVDMQKLFDAAQIHTNHKEKSKAASSSPISPDVILQLADRDVFCHSVVLRARSALFESFFGLDDWSARRWDENGTVRVNMRHLKWHAMRFVLGFMCAGGDVDMFRVLDFVNSTEDLVHFMFEVLSGANELHLDRLILICCSVILSHTNISNACFVLSDATHFRVLPLIAKLQEYISINLETFLENRILDDVPYALVKLLALFTRARQTEKSPFARGDVFTQSLLAKYADWIALQDWPEPITWDPARRKERDTLNAAKLSPTAITGNQTATPNKKAQGKMSAASALSAVAASFTPKAVLRRPPSGDDIFAMDEPEVAPEPAPAPPPAEATSSPVWKARIAPKVDMKTLMAEAASQQKPIRHQASGQNLASSSRSSMDAPPSASPGPKGWRLPPPGSTPPAPGLRDTIRSTQAAPVTPTRPPLGAARTPTSVGPSGATAGPNSNSARDARTSALTPMQASTSGNKTPNGPVMGPVITPTRQAPAKNRSDIRKTSGGKAWAQPTTQLLPTPSVGPTRGISFVAIQHAQQEQTMPVVDKRSLREIQEEEHALQEEADFLKWWTAEEERIRREEEQALALAQAASAKPSNANKKGRKKEKERRKNR
ncbi:hypothetical protein D9619_006824 [Psilocybe cf. subviscida]|uniref:BTB domain-containing protein n=1 Tax=Psilocybe cf. subviscida TaxID=2480587 RepID=A0A8H5B615_9AGAR|nr:hypothetical protein D9619_006824 [Psilocybe cf. subviscida]